MCLRSQGVRSHQRWHWAGDEVVPDPVIRAARQVPGSRRKRYPIDIRSFVGLEGSAVLREALGRMERGLPENLRPRLHARDPESFDFRARTVARYVGRKVRYDGRGRRATQWLFPEETLSVGAGDCEDRAFLLAAMLEASGISAYCIRVALGKLRDHVTGVDHDHGWVVYQDSRGAWTILEPGAGTTMASGRRPGVLRRKRTPEAEDAEYLPAFVFNRHHLWRVRGETGHRGPLHDFLMGRSFRGFDPTFGIRVHESIYDSALMRMSEDDLDVVKSESFWVDVDTLGNDPRDHFDFAYVKRGWRRVRERLRTGRLADFALAAHAVCDFYAHTVYAELAEEAQGLPVGLYDPEDPFDATGVAYDFRPYAPIEGANGAEDPVAAAGIWAGKLISGQWWRWYTTYPDDLERDVPHRRTLPDHDLLAVDGPTTSNPRHRYPGKEHRRQFDLRRSLAIRHLMAMHASWTRRS